MIGYIITFVSFVLMVMILVVKITIIVPHFTILYSSSMHHPEHAPNEEYCEITFLALSIFVAPNIVSEFKKKKQNKRKTMMCKITSSCSIHIIFFFFFCFIDSRHETFEERVLFF